MLLVSLVAMNLDLAINLAVTGYQSSMLVNLESASIMRFVAFLEVAPVVWDDFLILKMVGRRFIEIFHNGILRSMDRRNW